MKKFILGFICGLLLMGTTFAATELNVVPNPFPVFIDGVQAAVEGYNINGFTYLKLADFKQAGLIVKFNETDKQIEITQADSSTDSSENIQTSETTVPVVLPYEIKRPESVTTEEDGLTYLTLNGVKYVNLTSVNYKLDHTIYGFYYYYAEQRIDICNPNTEEVVLYDLPFILHEGHAYTNYDYFQTNILPLLE